MLLGYFTEEAYEKLLHEIPQNADNYSSNEDWLPTYFGSSDGYFKTSSVDVSMFVPSYTPGKKMMLKNLRKIWLTQGSYMKPFVTLHPCKHQISICGHIFAMLFLNTNLIFRIVGCRKNVQTPLKIGFSSQRLVAF